MASQKEAMVFGAIAGAVTVLTETLTIDPASLIKGFDLIVFLGYCVKALILMALGAIVVRVNQELNILKAFQLGIMAPALIVGIQSGSNLKEANKELLIAHDQIQQLQAKDIKPDLVSTVESKINYNFLIATVLAKDVDRKGKLSNVSVLTRFWYGLTGNLDNGWFVITGSHKNKAAAVAQASKLASKGWNVEIGEAFLWGGYYSVLIGSYLSKSEATAIRNLAIRDGLPKDTYIWRR